MDIDITKVLIQYVILLFALCFHEWGHAMSAKLLGDRTAELQGRLTMNPVSHMDPLGTVVFPIIMLITQVPYLFGWAKPVPVNPLSLRKMKDIVWVALAGPACNLTLVILAVIVAKVAMLSGNDPWGRDGKVLPVWELFEMFVHINLLLFFFNLIPVTPLDGSKVLLANVPGHSRFVPFWQAYEQYGPYILLILMFTGGLGRILYPPLEFSIDLIHKFLGVHQ